jgi:molybdopterin molybdotransferase
LKSDILCLTGGVSKGTRDFVPDVLQELGVEAVFHGCDIKPGKPIWFGSLPAGRADDGRSRWIFGLPGNPVSTMVCFELFVRTAIRRLQGIEPAAPALIPARLTAEHVTRDSRRTFAPAMLDVVNGKFEVRPLKWQGSFDLHSAAQANSLVVTPAARTYSAGETLDVLPLRS